MAVIIEPKIIVEKIELKINENDENAAKNTVDTLGPTMPVVKINDYILSIGEVKDFKLNIGINKLPSFSISVDDNNYRIRRELKKSDLDKTVIFIGYKDWYIKFNGIILSIPSEAGDSSLYLEGKFFNPKLYESIQKSYNEKSITDVLKDICTLTDMGLFTIENESLSNVLDFNLNTNKKHLIYFDWLIKNYTNNIWSVDTYGYFHVADIESLRKQKIDKFSIFDGKKVSEKDIIITTDNYYANEETKDKFKVEYYTINSNIGSVIVNNNKDYEIQSSGLNSEIKKLKSNALGFSSESNNTFDRFLKTTFTNYLDIINKDIGGKVISLSMSDLIYEITPFSIVKLEVFLPKLEGTKILLDEENSGNKIVINYSFEYKSAGGEEEEKFPKIRQYIDLI